MKQAHRRIGTRLSIALPITLVLAFFVTAEAAQTARKKPRPRPSTATPGRSVPDAQPADLKQRLDTHNVALRSGNPAAVVASSRALAALGLRLIAESRLSQELYQESIDAYRQALDLEDSADTRLDLALTQIGARKLDDALVEVKGVLEKNPRSARAWRVQSKVFQSKGDFAAEAESLARSLEISADPNVEYALGVAFLNAKEKAKADAVFKQIIAVNGDRAIYHVMFGDAYRDAEHFPDAIREFKRAIAMDPKVDHAYFFLGYTYLLQNHYGPNEDSLREFRQAVLQHPDEFFANFYLGVMESSYKLFDDSNRHLATALKSDPLRMEAWLYLGLNAYQQADYPNAKKYLLKTIELAAGNEEQNNFQVRRAYTSLGRILAREGNREEAAKYVRRAKEMESRALQNAQSYVASMSSEDEQMPGVLSQLPKPQPEEEGAEAHPSAGSKEPSLTPEQKRDIEEREKRVRTLVASSFNDWGTAEARQGMFGQALIHFHEAERWDPNTPGLMRNIGMASIRVEGYGEAVRTLSVAVEQNPSDKLARSLLGVALFSLNRYSEAAKQFNLVGEELLNDVRVGYAWAFSLSRDNQPKEASAVLDKLTAKQLPADLFVLSGQIYGALGNHEYAIQCYRKALAVSPKFPKAHYYAGLAFIRLDHPTDAIAEFREEMKISPSDPEVKYHLAFALLQASHNEEALRLLREVVDAHPDHAQAQYQLGKQLLAQGAVEESIPYLVAAAHLDPDKDYVHYQLQTAYRRAGRKAEADRELKVYQDIKNKARGRPTSAH